jgi:prolyl 4-hydroxylase
VWRSAPPALRQGVKYSATKWIHISEYKDSADPTKPFDPNCVDLDKGCDGWAFDGECEKNPVFMLKQCRMSCNACDTPAPGGGAAST